MYKIIAFTLLLFANNIFAATASVAVPTITNSVSAGTTFKFTETLSGKLPAGYKVKIDLNNGKGLVAMTCSGTTCTLSSNALPKDVDSAKYKVGIYDAIGVLQGKIIDGNYVIASVATSTTYTKISNTGVELPDTAALGSGANDWACTKDNNTGLIWEVKTRKGGLQDWSNTYTNYFAGEGYDWNRINNTDVIVSAVNKQKLCGASDWYLPPVDELKTLIFCSDGKYEGNGSCTNYKTVAPTVSIKYFPNTQSDWYWTSSPVASRNGVAWSVNFGSGYSDYNNKFGSMFVRLVRNQ